ncbi:hypothetical protein [Spiroplasma endosymbiont of Aspidapion aeneum]|uniref:hypothetical protein n=1 Tax=Spiroplasma endosymbiont of Aspidapion aeneum TaxID=3066276 RepID=UPI00313BCA76
MKDINFLRQFNLEHNTNSKLENEDVNEVFNYIDYVFFKRNVIFNTILKLENENNCLKNVYERYDDRQLLISNSQLISYIYEIKNSLETIIFNENANFLNQPVFIELKKMIYYFRDKIDSDIFKLTSDWKFSIDDHLLHEQISSFNYFYSSFDKITSLLEHLFFRLTGDHPRPKIEEKETFGSRIIKLSSQLTIDSTRDTYFRNWINLVSNSGIITIIRFKRNSLSHDFLNFTLKYNLSLISFCLYILIMRFLSVLSACIKDKRTLAKNIQKR